MKKIFKIITLFLFALNCNAQAVVNINTFNQGNNSNKYFKDIDNFYQNFTGTWENTSGSITFRLIIWKETNAEMKSISNSHIDLLKTKYLIIENLGTETQRVLYNSVRFFKISGTTTQSVMNTWAVSGNGFRGIFTDTNANNRTRVLTAIADFSILNLGTAPLQAHWKLKGLALDEDDYFSVPTDVILTKVN